MTDPAFGTFNAYLPYDNRLDFLTVDILHRVGITSLQSFPESSDSSLTKSGSISEAVSPNGDYLNPETREKCRMSIILQSDLI